jgi:hypothetical protein
VSGSLPDISPLTTGHFGPLLPDTGVRSTGRVKEESKEEGAAGGVRDTPPPAPGDIEEARRLLADPASPEYVRRAAQKALDRADGPTSSTGDRVGDNGTRPAGEVPEVIDYGEDLEAFKASFRTPDTEPEEEEQTP